MYQILPDFKQQKQKLKSKNPHPAFIIPKLSSGYWLLFFKVYVRIPQLMTNHALLKTTLLECLKEAGALLKGSISDRQVIAKKSELSIVTATDPMAEELIIGKIKSRFPGHNFLAEESSPTRHVSESRWIIDPLDGTTNFAHTFPASVVSIAYEESGIVQLGGVYDPFRDELFFAEKGNGSTLNGRPITVSKTPVLSESLLATGFPYDCKTHGDDYLAMFKEFMIRVQGIRRVGAAALDLCYVASGRFDGFWELKLNAWDQAAGMLIVEEAGGKLSTFSGKPMPVDSIQTLASNGFIHEAMLKILEPYRNYALT